MRGNNGTNELAFVIVEWPNSQLLSEIPGWEDHCHLINDERGIAAFGSGAYFVNKAWYDAHKQEMEHPNHDL